MIFRFNTKRVLFVAAAIFVTLSPGGFAEASTWAGGSSDWSNNTPPTGWNGTGVPNAIGAIADNPITATGTTIQNVAGGVTVGTLSLSGSGNFAWTHTLTNPITFNQDGAGSGFATISNSDSAADLSNSIQLSAGTITLADDLLISNTGGSTNTTGAIQIIGTVGGAGNVTLSNVSTALTQAGSIRFQTGVNTFTGNVLVKKGTTTFNVATALGAATNPITLGESGQGSAALLSTTNINMANPIIVASGSGGTLTLGTVSTSAFTGYSGAITLNGNVSLTSPSTTNAMTISSVFSGQTPDGGGVNTFGAGGIIKDGTGITTITGNNMFTGGITVNSGSLFLGASQSFTGGMTINGGTLRLAAGGAANLSTLNSLTFGPGSTGVLQLNGNSHSVMNLNTDATVGTSAIESSSGTRSIVVYNSTMSNTYAGTLRNGVGVLRFQKDGFSDFTLSGTNTMTGNMTVVNGTLIFDYTTNNTNKFAGDLLLAGGNVIVTPNASADTVQSATFTTVAQGGGTVTVNKNAGSNNSTLNLNVITRSSPGTLNVAYGGSGSGTASLTTDNTNDSNGILGAWATFGNDWAINSTNVADGRIEAIASGSYTPVATAVPMPDNSVAHVLVDSTSTGSVGLSAATTNVYSLNIKDAANRTINSANTLHIESTSASVLGGILASGGNHTINAPILAGPADTANELLITSNSQLTINSAITDNGVGATNLNTSGTGVVTLTNPANSFSNTLRIASGTLRLGASEVIPNGAGKGTGLSVFGSGKLDLNGNNETVNALVGNGNVTNNGASPATLTIGDTDPATFTYTGAVVNGASAASLDKIGAGIFLFNNVIGNGTGNVRLSAGTLTLGSNVTLGSGTLTLAGGTLTTNATNRIVPNNIVVAPSTIAIVNPASGAAAATGVMTLTGAITGTGTIQSIGGGPTADNSTYFRGDISGFQGTFEYFLGGGASNRSSSWVFDGASAGSYDGSQAKFTFTGDLTGSSRTIRIGNNGSPAVFKMGDLSGTTGRIAGNAPGAVTLEVGHLNTDAAYGGLINTNSVNTFNFRKVGTGAQTLSGVNNYNGTTTVSQGTLIAGSNAVSTTIADRLAPVTLATDVFTYAVAPADPLTLGQQVWLGGAPTTIDGAAPLSFTTYFVINPTATAFQLSLTDGGAPIDASAGGAATTINRFGAFGSTTSAVAIGDANTGSNNVALLTGGPFEIERPVSVTSNGSGTATIGGNTPDISTFSGAISLAKNARLTSAASGTVNVSGVISGSGFGVTKVGSGLATLSAANTYTGDTTVQEGTLSITNAFLANTAAVRLTTGAILDLNFVGTDSINALFIDAVSQALGVWGATGSGAAHESSLLTGTGFLLVTPAGLAGDYNGDNKVDAADYVLWRKNPGAFGGTPGGYNTWRANFGNPPGSGSNVGGNAAVPEPASTGLVALGVVLLVCRRKGTRR